MRRFWHVGINVTDMDRSIRFYQLLGFRVLDDKEVRTPQVGRAFMVDGADHLRFAHMRIGESPDEAMLDLVEWKAPSVEGRAQVRLSEPGLCRFSIVTDDIDGEYERLSAAGVHFLQPPETVSGADGNGGWRLLFGQDPDGTVFHFVQLA